MLTRRQLLKTGAVAGASLALPWARAAHALPGGKLSKYSQPLPVPGAGIVVARQTSSGSNQYAFEQVEITRQLHPQLPPTPIWAYDDGSGLAGQAGSLGMAVVAHSGTPLDVSFTNLLPETYPVWLPVETRLTPDQTNTVRVMTHLHGGFVAANSDGSPAVTPYGFVHNETQTVSYPNRQRCCGFTTTLWGRRG